MELCLWHRRRSMKRVGAARRPRRLSSKSARANDIRAPVTPGARTHAPCVHRAHTLSGDTTRASRAYSSASGRRVRSVIGASRHSLPSGYRLRLRAHPHWRLRACRGADRGRLRERPRRRLVYVRRPRLLDRLLARCVTAFREARSPRFPTRIATADQATEPARGLTGLLLALPWDERAAIALVDQLGLTYAAGALVLGIDISTGGRVS
jgi:hypothetical protein